MNAIGQKTINSVMGKQIYELSKQDDVRVILDIGTCNGMGTTKCIIDGIIDSKKTKYTVYSLECREDRWLESMRNLTPIIPNVFLIQGTIVDYTEIEPLLNNWKEDDLEFGWLKEDIEYLKTTSNVMKIIPNKIDLLIIDGGEFSGWIEFQRLYDRCKYIAMDDTSSFKSKQSREFVISNPDKFEVILDDQKENCLICKNLKY